MKYLKLHKKSFICLIVIALLTLALFVFMGYIMRDVMSASSLYMLALGAAIGVIIEYSSWKFFFVGRPLTFLGKSTPYLFLGLLLVSLIMAVVLEGLTSFGSLVSSFSDPSTWNKKRLIIFYGLSYAGLFLLIKFLPIKFFSQVAFFFKRVNWKVFFIRFVVIICVGLGILALGLALLKGNQQAIPYSFFVLLVFCCIVFAFWNKENAGQHPERLFLAIALPCGIFIALAIPPQTGNSWDDQIHYERSVALSYVVDPAHSLAELTLDNPLIPNEDSGIDRPGVSQWNLEDITEYENELDQIYKTAPFSINRENLQSSPYDLGYIPAAFGIWVARVLHLSLSGMVFAGRIFNLFFYCAVCFLAIKIAPIKKVLFSVIALLPTCIFLAANYSYDPWVISLLMLAFALFLKEYSDFDAAICFRRCAAMLIIALIAIAPKAVYFPMLALFLLMPKKKFQQAKMHRLYIASVCLFMAIAVLSFIVPFFGTANNTGDIRGGADVNQPMQLQWILENPLQYGLVLINFFINSYLPLGEFGFSFSYLQIGYIVDHADFLSMPLLLVIIVAILDSNRRSNKIANRRTNCAAWGAYLVTIILVATALYLSFTPVGADTVNGCQKRYLLPLLSPLFSLGLNLRIMNNMSQSAFILFTSTFSALFLLMGIWSSLLLHFPI